MGDLGGRVYVVTGAGRGLGRAYACAIARAGGSVIVNDIDKEAARAVAEEITLAGGDARASQHDVAIEADALIEAAIAAYDRLDGLVNNAGLLRIGDPTQETAESIAQVVGVNLIGVIACGLAAIRRMRRDARPGVIVNITSGAALGMRGLSLYGATKAAVSALTASWAADLAPEGIRVVGVSPVAATRMFAASGRTDTASPPEDIAPLVVFLLSDRARGLDGQILRLSNGALSIVSPAANGPEIARRDHWNVETIATALAGRV